jgi:dynein heavy chain
MIDPQCQALNWLKNQMGLKDYVNIFDNVQDKNCLRSIEKAIQFGNVILIKDITDEIDTIFTPLISKS